MKDEIKLLISTKVQLVVPQEVIQQLILVYLMIFVTYLQRQMKQNYVAIKKDVLVSMLKVDDAKLVRETVF